MANVQFDGFDQMMQALENAGRLDTSTIAQICKAGAAVVLNNVKSDKRFGKYAVAKKQRSGIYSIYYTGNVTSGYSAFGAAKVYEEGRKAKARGSKKARTSEQKSNPFFGNLIKSVEGSAVEAMQKKLDGIMESLK